MAAVEEIIDSSPDTATIINRIRHLHGRERYLAQFTRLGDSPAEEAEEDVED